MTLLDGNALAGPLSGVLGTDPTSAVLRCADCGSTAPLAVAVVYRTAMGSVVRCRGCDAVLVTVVTTGRTQTVSMPGTRTIAIDAAMLDPTT